MSGGGGHDRPLLSGEVLAADLAEPYVVVGIDGSGHASPTARERVRLPIRTPAELEDVGVGLGEEPAAAGAAE